MLQADEMPDNNAELASVQIEFPRLDMDTADGCPTEMKDVMDYLAIEVPGGHSLVASDLTFLRTAQVEDTRYWIWRFTEPDGNLAYATCSVGPDGAQTVGYDDDYYGLTPEQFILGDYHQVF
jgi:hypothetical protein